MGKNKNRKSRDSESNVSTAVGKRNSDTSNGHKERNSNSSVGNSGDVKSSTTFSGVEKEQRPPVASPARRSILQWCWQERRGILWVFMFALGGSFLGFGIGSGLFTGEFNQPPSPWRVALGMNIRETTTYQMLSLKILPWETLLSSNSSSIASDFTFWQILSPGVVSSHSRAVLPMDAQVLRKDPSHPNVFAVLREAIVREKGGFVHPDLGILQPARSGASRGIGMVRDSWHKCQNQCFPGIAQEKLAEKHTNTTDDHSAKNKNKNYKQEEVLIKVPVSFQMTRSVALETLLPRITSDAQRKTILELDDAAILVLFLAHERGQGHYSRWLPYIASLPLEPSCGYSLELRPYLLDTIQALKNEVGLDVKGWPAELLKATQYAESISTNLAKDYGPFLQHPKDMDAEENIQWALCQVASRATAGSTKHGSLRMVPMMDMVNHDVNAGGFVELLGTERLEEGDFIDANEDDSGTFVVRSLRHGRRKALKVGQELLVNYNVPHYSALDWFISLGFVPPERWAKWQKMDAALPRVRRDGPFGVPGAAAPSQNGGNVNMATSAPSDEL